MNKNSSKILYQSGIFSILFFIIIIFITCNKDEKEIEVKGRVYDPQLVKYLSGATVRISSSKIVSGVYNSNYQEITSATTDKDGNFSFTIAVEKVSGYRLNVNKDDYFDYTVDIEPEILEENDTYSDSYNLYPECYINLHVKNVTPFDGNDKISYKFTSGTLNCFQCCNDGITTGNGKNYEETKICRVHGNQYVGINWIVTKNSNTFSSSDSIYCPAFQTVYYQIHY